MGTKGTSIESVVDAEIVSVGEELTGKTLGEFRGQVTDIIEEGRGQIILDCKALKIVNSEGLDALLWVIEEVQKLGGCVKIASLGLAPRKIFEITQFDRIFELYDDVIAALRSL